MVEGNNSPGEAPAEDSDITRRTMMQASAVAGAVPIAGYGASTRARSAAVASERTISVPDVTVSNLTDRTRSLQLSLDVAGAADEVATADVSTVEVGANQDATIESLPDRFDASAVRTFADVGSASLSVAGADGTADSVAIDTGLSASNEIVDVVVTAEKVRVSVIHFDTFETVGGEF